MYVIFYYYYYYIYLFIHYMDEPAVDKKWTVH